MPFTTNWKFNSGDNNLEDWENYLDTKIQSHTFDLPEDAYPQFDMQCVVQSEHINLRGKDICYSTYGYSVQDGTSRSDYLMTLYQVDEEVGVIVDSPSRAKSFLRQLFGYDETTRKDIILVQNDDVFFNNKLFFWIISKIYNEEPTVSFTDVQDNVEYSLQFTDLGGLKGKTEGILNRVSTQGNNVINMLTTLSFLLESDQLTEVQLSVCYKKHKNINIKVHLNNISEKFLSIDVKEQEYLGELRETSGNDDEKLRSLILLMTHLEFIPTLTSVCKTNTGGVDVKKDLTQSIIDDVSLRIHHLGNSLKD